MSVKEVAKINGICSICIDKRFDLLATQYLNLNIVDFYLIGTAGSGLSLGYQDFCSKECNCECNNSIHNDENVSCDPSNDDMELLKNNFVKNIEISETLGSLSNIYILNHQDCGAIKAYLGCSGYPRIIGENNALEIKIQTDLLLYAKKYLVEKFPDITVILGLIDINGTVCDYNEELLSWELRYRGSGKREFGTWYSL
jgi:hypothetical protein